MPARDQGYQRFHERTATGDRRMVIRQGGGLTIETGGTLTVDGSFAYAGRADSAEIIVGAAVGNTRTITIQLKDGNGADCATIQTVTLHVFVDVDGSAWATTGGTTGIAIGGSGSLLVVVSKLQFSARSDASGALEVTWTDTGSEVAYLGVATASGGMTISAALTI